jgi:hypothetical protein
MANSGSYRADERGAVVIEQSTITYPKCGHETGNACRWTLANSFMTARDAKSDLNPFQAIAAFSAPSAPMQGGQACCTLLAHRPGVQCGTFLGDRVHRLADMWQTPTLN